MSAPSRCVALSLLFAATLAAQDPFGPPGGGPPGGGFPGGFGGPGGPGGGPGGMRERTKVLTQFDADKNGALDANERKAARAWLKENRPQRGRRGPGGPGGFGGPPGGFGGPGGEGGNHEDQPGVHVTPNDVPSYADRPLFDADVVRTYFFEVEGDDWYGELTDFYHTDVEVPATLTVDGKVYHGVGMQFRGNTSFMSPGKKKSIDVTIDLTDKKQQLHGVRNLDLINGNGDPSSMREAIHGFVANQFFPSARVAIARVVINGEDFGLYAATQQFDKDFLQDHFGTTKGDRWKVPPDFSGGGGLRYAGDEPAAYRRSYELKSSENARAWQGLVDVCAALEQAPDDRLEAILPQHLDVDAALWFLAIDMALGDDDGYFSRASDYVLYRDPSGRFHPIPRDNNEILPNERGGMRAPGGPGGPGFGGGGERRDGQPGGNAPQGQGSGGPPGGRGPGGMRGPGGPGGGVANAPLQGAGRADRPLLHRLLAVPTWKQRYLANLRALAEAMADDQLGKRIATWRKLVEPLAKIDGHSLYGFEAFTNAFATDDNGKPAARSLMATVAQRRKAILDDASMQGAWPEVAAPKVAANGEGENAMLTITCKAGGTRLAAVRLHTGQGAFGAFTTTEMVDDGKHGDGSAGDGVFGASVPAPADGAMLRYWVEAVAAESNHVACQPVSNGARPFVWPASATTKSGKGK